MKPVSTRCVPSHELNLSSLYVGDDSAAKTTTKKTFWFSWSAMLAVALKPRLKLKHGHDIHGTRPLTRRGGARAAGCWQLPTEAI